MNFTLFVTALLTGLGFVGLVTVLARLLAPRSFNPQKEDVRCGHDVPLPLGRRDEDAG